MSVELVICPLCRSEIHRHVGGRVVTRARVPYQNGANAMTLMAEMARVEREEELAACERSCTTHYEERHRLRLRLWRRFGYRWLLRWPTRDPRKALRLDQTAHEPTRFIR